MGHDAGRSFLRPCVMIAIFCASSRNLLKEYFSAGESITCVFLFGSATGERFSDRSDIDIAVLYDPHHLPTPDERPPVAEQLSDRIHYSVDLVVLNNASPILGYQVLKHGERLLVRDRHRLQRFRAHPEQIFRPEAEPAGHRTGPCRKPGSYPAEDDTFSVKRDRGKIPEQFSPHSSVDRALPSGGKNPRSSRGGGTF